MKYVLDTSAYSDFNRGDFRLKKFFNSKNEILLPLIVVGELRAGFAAGNKKTENEILLQRMLDAPNVMPVSLKVATTTKYAETYLQLRRDGAPISSNDIWIAALAIEQDVPILTTDGDFSKVKNLKTLKL